jgi:hypothetical protein
MFNRFIGCVLLVVLLSCSSKQDSGYENEDVLMKFIQAKEVFSNNDSYSIVTVKSKIYCLNCMPSVKISDVIHYIQSVHDGQYKNKRIFIVTDGELPDVFVNDFLHDKNIEIVVEETLEMQRYGIYHTNIHWFFIEKNTLQYWKFFMTEEDFVVVE